MKKIEKENGKIYEVEIEEYYGALSIKKTLIGTYDEKPKIKKGKKEKETD
jgi:hypothetical protein